MIQNQAIDGRKTFDWGRTSDDYAKYRDIYPPAFYQKLLDLGLCVKGQRVLDLGTGTGVLPRALYPYGASFTGADVSENQIHQARRLSAEQNMNIHFLTASAENCDFPADSFDIVTACQCHFYFDHEIVTPKIARMLKPHGRYVILYMAWLPREDSIAGASESLVLQYNPHWSGRDETRHPIQLPSNAADFFTVEHSLVFDLCVPFTRESWDGRMRACRGIGASLSPQEAAAFSAAHMELLQKIAPEAFTILHYAAITVLQMI